MKTNTLLLTCVIVTTTIFAQVPGWQWVEGAGGSGHNYGTAVSCDGNGNSFVTGHFQFSSSLFGSGSQTTAVSGSGNVNMFLAKYDSLGKLLWAKGASAAAESMGFDVKADSSGNSYLFGTFVGDSMVLGSTKLYALTTGSLNTCFVVKYDPQGNPIWAKPIASAVLTPSSKYAISIDAVGNSYITGRFTGISIQSCLVKLDNTGNVVWAKNIQTSGVGYWDAGDVEVDVYGNTCITGQFTFPSVTFDGTTLTNNSAGKLLFVAKYDPSGTLLWALCPGQHASLYNSSVSADNNHNVYVTGHFDGDTAVFGSHTLTGTGAGMENIFVAKINGISNVLWVRSANVLLGAEAGHSIYADANGNSYVTGKFAANIAIGTHTLHYTGGNDLMVLKFDPSGNILWTKTAGAALNEIGRGISVNHKGEVFVTGEYTSVNTVFDNDTLKSPDVSGNTHRIFLAKIRMMPDVLTGNGIVKRFSASTITLYPVPADDVLFVRFETPIVEGKLKLLDYNGKTVAESDPVSGYSLPITVSDLPPGIYFLAIHEKNGNIAVRKVLVSQ